MIYDLFYLFSSWRREMPGRQPQGEQIIENHWKYNVFDYSTVPGKGRRETPGKALPWENIENNSENKDLFISCIWFSVISLSINFTHLMSSFLIA